MWFNEFWFNAFIALRYRNGASKHVIQKQWGQGQGGPSHKLAFLVITAGLGKN